MNAILIDISTCDGCGGCVKKCPKNVLSLIELTDDEIKELSFWARLTVKMKGRQKASVQFPDSCNQCGICRKKCHLRAIKMTE